MADHKAVVGEIYAAFGRGDVPSILDRLAPDVAWESWSDHYGQRAGVPWLAARRGPAGVGLFFEALRGLEFHGFAVDWIVGGGPHVVAHVSVDVLVKETARRYQDEELHLWTLDDQGRVTAFRHYCDTAKHIAAAGRA